MHDMINVKVSVQQKDIPLQRQSPGSKGIWKNCHFYFDDELTEYDYWVVIDNLSATEITKCPKANTLLLTAEPPQIKTYSGSFTKQFAQIITNIRDIRGVNVTYGQTAIMWHLGREVKDGKSVSFRMNYDDWSALRVAEKSKNLSVIASNKSKTAGHRQRLAFVEALKDHFKDRIDIFGRGFNEIPDKWNAIAKYKYHVVLENCSYPDYWTEKLGDCYLGLTYPIYYGCPNIADYFPENSYQTIDIQNVKGSIEIIESLLESDRYRADAGLVKVARDLLLNKYNFFPMITEFVNAHYSTESKEEIVLHPQKKNRLLSLQRLIKYNLLK